MQTQGIGQISQSRSILPDADFERRLKRFDSRLGLVFDQMTHKWVIVEAAYDNSGFNIVLVCEHENGDPKPLGEWVFNKLYVMHQKWLQKKNVGADKHFENMIDEAKKQKADMEKKADSDNIDMIKDDRNLWRKAARELNGEPTSDVTAGYQTGGLGK